LNGPTFTIGYVSSKPLRRQKFEFLWAKNILQTKLNYQHYYNNMFYSQCTA